MDKILKNNFRLLNLIKVLFVISLFIVKNSSYLLLILSSYFFIIKNKIRKNEDRIFLYSITLLISFFILNSLLNLNNSAGCLVNFFSEGKFIFFLSSLYYSYKIKLSCDKEFISNLNNFFVDIFILGSFSYVLISIVTVGEIFRFPDRLYFSTDINSSNYGFLALLLIVLSEDLFYFLILSILLFISGSGSCLIAYLYVLYTKREFFTRIKFFNNKKYNHLILIAVFLSIFAFFLYGQSLRGRSIFNVMEIDRVNIFVGYISYLVENLNIYIALFGNGPFVLLTDMMKFIPSESVRLYLYLEPGILGAKILHNDFLRIFHTYGLLGIGAMLLIFKRLKYPWFLPLSIAALFGSPFFSTPLFIFLNFYFIGIFSLRHNKLK